LDQWTGAPANWSAYLAAVVIVALATLILHLADPYLPLARFPFLHILAVMAVAYLFGLGPTILALGLSLLAFVHLFVMPVNSIEQIDVAFIEVWAALTAWTVGMVLGGAAMLAVRGSRQRVETLARQLQEQRALLDAFMQNVPVGLGFHDRETRHLMANLALAEMNGKSLEEIQGATVWDILPHEMADKAAAAIQHVFETGEPSSFHDLPAKLDGEKYYDVRHVPVSTPEGEIIGVGVVVVDVTEHIIARQALERSYEYEHHIARSFESAVLGTIPNRIACFMFETAYRAAFEEARVGGDFYDVFPISESKIGIVIGDVSGKGLKAAVQVAMAKYTIRSHAYEDEHPKIVMKHLNLSLARQMDIESFITVFMGIIDCRTKTMTYTNAGHTPVMFWDASEDKAAMLPPTGPITGLDETGDYEEQEISLDYQDEILLSTDGLMEIRRAAGTLEPEDLITIYAAAKKSGIHSAEGMIEWVLKASRGSLRDDVAVLRVFVGSQSTG